MIAPKVGMGLKGSTMLTLESRVGRAGATQVAFAGRASRPKAPGTSSFRIVPVAVPSEIVAFEGRLSASVRVSSASTIPSPRIVTLIVRVV